MATGYSEKYSQMSDDELLHLASHKDSLRDVARQGLEVELRKRGMGDAAALAYEKQGQGEPERQRQQAIDEKAEIRESRINALIGLPLFVIVILGTVWVAAHVFDLPGEAAGKLTKASLEIVTALFILCWAFRGRWLTFKKILVMSAILSAGIFVIVVLIVVTAPAR
jgi:hypothetical protein